MAHPGFGEKELQGFHVGANFRIKTAKPFPKSEGLTARLRSHTYKNRHAQDIEIGDIRYLAYASSRGPLLGIEQGRFGRCTAHASSTA
jgi:hypothetical protein